MIYFIFQFYQTILNISTKFSYRKTTCTRRKAKGYKRSVQDERSRQNQDQIDEPIQPLQPLLIPPFQNFCHLYRPIVIVIVIVNWFQWESPNIREILIILLRIQTRIITVNENDHQNVRYSNFPVHRVKSWVVEHQFVLKWKA